MKTKKSELVPLIIGVVVVLILAGMFFSWQMGWFKGKKQDIDITTSKIDSGISTMADFDITVYDNGTIQGDTLAELISDYKTRDIKVSLWVHTLDGTDTYYNYAYTTNNLGAVVTITPPPSKATAGYLTASANFLGDVFRNANNEIVCLKFTQQK